MIIDKSKISLEDLTAFEKIDYKKIEKEIDFTDIKVNKPWGYEYLLFENQDVSIWILYINPHHKTSMHCHENKNTSLISLSGQITCKTFDKENTLDELNGIYLGKKVFHQTLNQTENVAVVMEIETPVDKFDLVRLNDSYGREKKSYEQEDQYIKEENLTIKNIQKDRYKNRFGEVTVEIGCAQNKSELSKIYTLNNEKVIATLLNRNIWSVEGNKEFEIGQLLVLNNEILDTYSINDDFTYLLLRKD